MIIHICLVSIAVMGEMWLDKKIDLILDHINVGGMIIALQSFKLPANYTDHDDFAAASRKRKYCSRLCYQRSLAGKANMKRRKVPRPELEALRKQVEESGFSATGRQYGVSDNTIRKWLRELVVA